MIQNYTHDLIWIMDDFWIMGDFLFIGDFWIMGHLNHGRGGQTNKQTHNYTQKHINTMTRPGLKVPGIQKVPKGPRYPKDT